MFIITVRAMNPKRQRSDRPLNKITETYFQYFTLSLINV